MKSSSKTVPCELALFLQLLENIEAVPIVQAELGLLEDIDIDALKGFGLSLGMSVSLAGTLGKALSPIRFVYRFPVGF